MVKLITHAIISLGATALVLTQTGNKTLTVLGLGLLMAYITDQVIDRLGHEEGPHGPRRSWVTHTILIAQVSWMLIGFAIGTVAEQILLVTSATFAAVTAGLVASTLHIFADSLTMGGTYIPTFNPHLGVRRFRLGELLLGTQLDNNNLALNTTLIVLGLLALAFVYSRLFAPT